MAHRTITGSDFVNQGYDKLPLDVVLGEYEKGIAPDRISARFRNLERQLSELEKRQRELIGQPEVEQIRDGITRFLRDYTAEKKFIYSHMMADESFAWQRLKGNRSSRVAETRLIAESGVIPMDALFASEDLNPIERVQLADMKDSLGKPLLSYWALDKYVNSLVPRMQDTSRLGGTTDDTFSKLTDILYELNVLFPIAEERTLREGTNI